MTKIVIATSNSNKKYEIEEFMKDCNIEFCCQSDFQIKPCDEPYNTFVENALTKARHASQATSLPAIADDSGICVDALNGNPGILSARYAGSKATDTMNIKKLLRELEYIQNRRAHFYCSLVFIRNHLDPEPFITEGFWHGEILKEEKGSFGFGYDPIFFDYKTEKSAAELPFNIKNRISHRGQALQKLKLKIKMIYDQKK